MGRDEHTHDNEFELLLAEAGDDPGTLRRIAHDLASVDPLRSEGLLHAVPAHEQTWTRAQRRRWRAVEGAMQDFALAGLPTPRPAVDAIAARAYALAVEQAP